jgi:hypothetical protein
LLEVEQTLLQCGQWWFRLWSGGETAVETTFGLFRATGIKLTGVVESFATDSFAGSGDWVYVWIALIGLRILSSSFSNPWSPVSTNPKLCTHCPASGVLEKPILCSYDAHTVQKLSTASIVLTWMKEMSNN